MFTSKLTPVVFGQEMTIVAKLTSFPRWTKTRAARNDDVSKSTKTRAREVDAVPEMNEN